MKQALGQTLNWRAASTQSIPSLGHDEVHLWWLPLVLSEAQKKPALALLSDIQRDKYGRRATADLKHAYLAGRYYLLHLLAAYSNGDADQVELSYSRLNKPSLSNADLGIEFNFTDTSGADSNYGLFAFTLGRQIGVDIENRARNIDLSNVARRRFTPAEQDYVAATGEVDKEKALSIWTRKEAYGKATGKGINFKMNEENLVLRGTHANLNDTLFSFAFDDSHAKTWRCEQFQLGDEFIACVVHDGHQKLNFKTFSSLNIRANAIP